MYEEYRKQINKHLEVGKELMYLTKHDVVNTGITTDEVLSFTESALREHGTKRTEMPAKIGIHPLKDVFFHAMPALVKNEYACGMKWVECFPDNPIKYNLPQTSGLIILNEMYTGFPIAIMDCIWVTAKRTAAVAAISAKYLANLDAETFGMFGCGVQGIEHLEFLPKVLKKLKKIYVYDIYEQAIDKLIEKMQPKTEAKIIKAKTVQEVVDNCEVLASATKILEKPDPKVKHEWIRKGQTLLISDLDSFWELETMDSADKYLVDDLGQHSHFHDAGYYPKGMPNNLYGETGEVIAGVKNGRERKDELIVVNNVGMAVEDVVMARHILDKALTKGLGIRLPL